MACCVWASSRWWLWMDWTVQRPGPIHRYCILRVFYYSQNWLWRPCCFDLDVPYAKHGDIIPNLPSLINGNWYIKACIYSMGPKQSIVQIGWILGELMYRLAWWWIWMDTWTGSDGPGNIHYTRNPNSGTHRKIDPGHVWGRVVDKERRSLGPEILDAQDPQDPTPHYSQYSAFTFAGQA